MLFTQTSSVDYEKLCKLEAHETLRESFTWASRCEATQVVVENTTDYRYFAILTNVLASNNTYSLNYVYRKKSF